MCKRSPIMLTLCLDVRIDSLLTCWCCIVNLGDHAPQWPRLIKLETIFWILQPGLAMLEGLTCSEGADDDGVGVRVVVVMTRERPLTISGLRSHIDNGLRRCSRGQRVIWKWWYCIWVAGGWRSEWGTLLVRGQGRWCICGEGTPGS